MQWWLLWNSAPSHLNEILIEGGVFQTCHELHNQESHGDIFHHFLRRRVHAKVYILGNTEVDDGTSSTRVGLATGKEH